MCGGCQVVSEPDYATSLPAHLGTTSWIPGSWLRSPSGPMTMMWESCWITPVTGEGSAVGWLFAQHSALLRILPVSSWVSEVLWMEEAHWCCFRANSYSYPLHKYSHSIWQVTFAGRSLVNGEHSFSESYSFLLLIFQTIAHIWATFGQYWLKKGKKKE